MNSIEIDEIENIKKELLAYNIQAYNLINKCTAIQSEICSLGNKSISGFDDSVLEKAKNFISDKLVGVGRTLFVSRLNDLKKEYLDFFNKNYNLFERVNEFLKTKGENTIDINSFDYDLKLSIDNAVENDEWILDFSELCDKLRHFMQSTIDIVDHLYKNVETIKGR